MKLSMLNEDLYPSEIAYNKCIIIDHEAGIEYASIDFRPIDPDYDGPDRIPFVRLINVDMEFFTLPYEQQKTVVDIAVNWASSDHLRQQTPWTRVTNNDENISNYIDKIIDDMGKYRYDDDHEAWYTPSDIKKKSKNSPKLDTQEDIEANLDYEPQITISSVPNRKPNVRWPHALTVAVNYHRNHMNGKRWPALERAILGRASTYTAVSGDYVRPRVALFNYLTSIREHWPEGDVIAKNLVNALIKKNKNLRARLRALHTTPPALWQTRIMMDLRRSRYFGGLVKNKNFALYVASQYSPRTYYFLTGRAQ